MSVRSFGNPKVRYNAVMSKTGLGAASQHLTPITATGGTKATPGDGYVYHLFSPADPGNFVITAGEATMDVLIVGGGAGGGYDRGGGGGAGAFRPETFTAVLGTHPVSTGNKGGGDQAAGGAAASGGTTTFVYNSTSYAAPGGGGGTSDGESAGGDNGGSGGGTTGSPAGSTPWAGGSAVNPDYGYPGKGALGSTGTGGGGGGAGGGGPDTPGPGSFPTSTANIAGPGKTLPWIPTSYGSSGYFCGGGGGGGYQQNGPGQPGIAQSPIPGGGGRGGVDSPPGSMNAEDAVAKTGSGGGGGSGGGDKTGGDGADGIVLIRYSV